jgi:hypothetical protein
MRLFLFLFGVGQSLGPQKFSLRSLVSGNWSTTVNGKLRVIYFIPLGGIGHFQGLWNDHLLDIYVLSNEYGRVEFEGLNFTFQVRNMLDRHPSILVPISDSITLDVLVVSKLAVYLSFADRNKRIISGFGFVRPDVIRFTKMDFFKLVAYVTALAYFGKKTLEYLCKR